MTTTIAFFVFGLLNGWLWKRCRRLEDRAEKIEQAHQDIINLLANLTLVEHDGSLLNALDILGGKRLRERHPKLGRASHFFKWHNRR